MDEQPPHTRMPLRLRRCVIGGRAAPDDWDVDCDGVTVGRITKGYAPPDGAAWSWTVTCQLFQPRADHGGRSMSRQEAMRDWKAKWDELSPDIEGERRAHAEFVERMAMRGTPVE